MATEVQRAELGQREAGLETLEHVAVEPPAHAAVVVALVVQSEAGFLQRGKIAADGACRDLELAREAVNRRAVTRRLERVQHAPLADDLLVPRHDSSYRRVTRLLSGGGVPCAGAVGCAGGPSGCAVGALNPPGFDLFGGGFGRVSS